MEVPEIIDGLKDLIKDRESFIDQDEPDNVFEHDKDILNAAINALSAAPENKALKEQLAIKSEQLESLRTIFYEVTGSVPSRRPEKQTDNCAECVYDEPGYCSVIGTMPHCCERHWHCKPGAEAKDFQPKQEKEANNA